MERKHPTRRTFLVRDQLLAKLGEACFEALQSGLMRLTVEAPSKPARRRRRRRPSPKPVTT